MDGAVAVGADALGERLVSIVTILMLGPASHVGEVPLPVWSTLRVWRLLRRSLRGTHEGWLASVLFPSFESPCGSAFAGMVSSAWGEGEGKGDGKGEGEGDGEGEGESERHATAPKVRGGRGRRGPGRGCHHHRVRRSCSRRRRSALALYDTVRQCLRVC